MLFFRKMRKMIIIADVKWPFTIIQCHLFWGQWHVNEGQDNTGLISEASQDIDTESTEKSPPLQRTPLISA